MILGTAKKNSTWKVFAGIMILEDFPAVRGTWTNFISSGSIVFDLWHIWHTWHMWHVGHIWHVTRQYVLFSVFRDKYMHTFDRLFQWLSSSPYLCVLHFTLSNLLLMNGSWLVGGVFWEGILGVRLLAGPLIPCWVRVGEIRSSVWGSHFLI